MITLIFLHVNVFLTDVSIFLMVSRFCILSTKLDFSQIWWTGLERPNQPEGGAKQSYKHSFLAQKIDYFFSEKQEMIDCLGS
jgi:hypothetical protein